MCNNAHTLEINKQLEGTCVKIMQCFTSRKEALATLMLTNIINPVNTDCVSHLSLLTPNYTHSGLLAALRKGKIDRDKLTQVLLGEVKSKEGFSNIYTIDCTSWMRIFSKTVKGKMMVRDSQSANRGLAADAGWSYSMVAAQTRQDMAPVCFDRVGPEDELHTFTVNQIEKILVHEHTQRPLFVFDAGYSATTMTMKARERNLEVDLLVRLATNRVYWQDIPPDAPPKKGVKQKHGSKLVLKNPELKPTHVGEFAFEKAKVSYQMWTGFHQNLRQQCSASRQSTGLPVVSGTVLHFQKVGSEGPGLWLWFDGKLEERSPEELYSAYVSRFDIEHGFRFMKQSLGLTRFHTVSVEAADNWIQLQFAAYFLVSRMRNHVKVKRLPWEENKKVNTLKMVARGLFEHVGYLVRNLGVRISKNKGVGWPLGKPRVPRVEQKTHVKNPDRAGSARKFS